MNKVGMRRFLVLCLLLISGLVGSLSAIMIEKEIVIVVPSFRNIDWYERNLSSLFRQKYENYKIVYITDDPFDSDGTHAAVTSYVEKMGQAHRCTLIKNSERKGGLANLYHAIHACPDHAIVLTVDGDDWLKDEYVLARINRAYDNPQVWMTYGQFETWPMGPKGFCQEIPEPWVTHGVIRDAAWITSHLRTFYAWFFKKVKLKDLLCNNQFFMVTWDKAFMYPMLEMAHGRWKFIPDVLYVYNAGTPLNDYKVNGLEQMRCEKIICSRERYKPLPADFDYRKQRTEPLVDLFIFSEHRPDHLRTLLKSVPLMRGLGRVIIFWRATKPEQEAEYENIAREFSSHAYCRVDDKKRLSDAIRNYVLGDQSPAYCMYTGDTYAIKDKINLTNAVQALENTGAYCFNFLCARHHYDTRYPGIKRRITMPHFISLGKDVFAWQFSDGEYTWRNPYSEMAIYRTQDFKKLLEASEFDSLEQLKNVCIHARFDLDEVGLCCGALKVVSIIPE